MRTISRRKQYVEVLATHYIDGGICPRTIILADGRTFEIENVKSFSQTQTSRRGEIALKYTIIVHGQETNLFCDSGRYFVEMKENPS